MANIPGDTGTKTQWSWKTFLVAGLLLLFLLLLANSYPKYVIAFMLLLLLSVVIAHSNDVVKFLQ